MKTNHFGILKSLPNSRKQVLHKVVPALFADHDDGELDAQFAETPCRITNVAFQSIKVAFPNYVIAGIVKEAAFEEGDINEGTVKVHELKEEYLEGVRVLVFGGGSRVLEVCQVNRQLMVNLKMKQVRVRIIFVLNKHQVVVLLSKQRD